MTCDRPDNCFTHKYLLKDCPDGKRLDYIMYRSEKSLLYLCFKFHFDFKLTARLSCWSVITVLTKYQAQIWIIQIIREYLLFLLSKEVILKNFVLIFLETFPETISQQMRQIATEKQILTKSLKIIEDGELRVLWDRRLFLVLCMVLIALIGLIFFYLKKFVIH